MLSANYRPFSGNECKVCVFLHHQVSSSTSNDSKMQTFTYKSTFDGNLTTQTCKELKLPHKINIFLARVKATLRRCRMAKNPIPRVRAIEIMTMSRSCPWHESIVLTVTYG